MPRARKLQNFNFSKKNMIYEVFVIADHEYDIHFVIWGFATKDIAKTTKYRYFSIICIHIFEF